LPLLERAQADDHQRARIFWRPGKSPWRYARVVERRAYMANIRRRAMGRVVERGAGQHQHSLRPVVLLERGAQRRQAYQRSRAIERWSAVSSVDAVDDSPSQGISEKPERTAGREEAGAIRGNTRQGPCEHSVHEYDRGDAGGFGGRDGAEQNEVDDNHVRWRLPEFCRELLGPGRRP
jgi:hypothetical protein